MRTLLILVFAAACDRGAPRAGLAVEGSARGCEVVLGETKGKIASVAFSDGVRGKWLRQGDKIAAAFIAREDTPMSGVEVVFGKEGGAFEILTSHCYGSRGELLAGATVRR
jgi:hypothetical protein